MPFRRLTMTAVGVVALMALLAWTALQRLPPGTELPTHWNAAGQADGFAGAGWALFLPVALAAAISAVMALLPRIEPMQHRLQQSAPLLRSAWLGLLALMAVIELTIAAPAFGLWFPALLPMAAVGVLLIVIGNALPKSRPGFFVGIRTPWALTDPENWIATHRLGARTMIAGGAMIVAAALLPLDAGQRQTFFISAIVLAVLPPVIFSWWFWHRAHRG